MIQNALFTLALLIVVVSISCTASSEPASTPVPTLDIDSMFATAVAARQQPTANSQQNAAPTRGHFAGAGRTALIRTPSATSVFVPTPAPTLRPTPTRSPWPTSTSRTIRPTAILHPTLRPITPTTRSTPAYLPNSPLVHIGNTVYAVDLAITAAEQTKGLSGRPSLDVDQGMLFVFDEDAPRTFWMLNMRFSLDMIWIKSNCTVARITTDVPNLPLDTPRDQLPRYPSTSPIRFVLEINAGQAQAHNIVLGTSIAFDGEIAGKWGC